MAGTLMSLVHKITEKATIKKYCVIKKIIKT